MIMRAPATDLPIVFEDVGFLAREVIVVRDIGLFLGPGSPTVLIGPNGSGKTTLLRLAMGLGMVLITLIILVNAAAWSVRRLGELRAG